jgi:hypothetical protein
MNKDEGKVACISKDCAMKAYMGIGGKNPRILDLDAIVDVGELSPSGSHRFNPEERGPRAHWIGDRVGPKAVLGLVAWGRQRKPIPCI